MAGKLFCGAAKVDITPGEDEVTGLCALMGISYAGIIDRLAARVIALKNDDVQALVVSFDLDKAPEPSAWIPMLAEHTGVPEGNILYFGTHTHSAPLTTVRPREKSRANEEQKAAMSIYEECIRQKLLACADEAIASMRPARMGCAYGESFVNVNRNADFIFRDEQGVKYPFINEGMNWGAPVDRTLLTVRFEDLDGQPIAFFINYPLHCCLMFLNDYDGEGHMGISGDIAGNTCSLMEERFSGAVAVWSSGAAGDVDPVLFNVFIYPDPADGHVVKEPILDWKVSAAQLRMIVGWHLHDILRTMDRIVCDREEAEIGSALTWSETPSITDDPYRIRVQALRIGDALLLGIGGELYNSFGKMLREESEAPYTAVINHTASLIDDAGYILDDDAILRASKEAPGDHFIPGGRVRFKPGYVGDSLRKCLQELTADWIF